MELFSKMRRFFGILIVAVGFTRSAFAYLLQRGPGVQAVQR